MMEVVMGNVQNLGEFGELACDCGSGKPHTHDNCTSGMRCRKCGITTYYEDALPQFVSEGGEVSLRYKCRYCGSFEYSLWNNYGDAVKMGLDIHRCICQNNGDYCDFCQVLLSEPNPEGGEAEIY
jgi:hypothetical protein